MLKLGLIAGYSGAQLALDVERIQEAERLGYDSVWTAEAWGSDAVTPLAWIGARTERIRLGTGIMQLPARSPAMTAMTAMTLDQLSGGRFICGLGTSGPQVVEGWHGVPFHAPITWMREYVEILRRIFARQEALSFQGKRFRIPYDGPDGSGAGKPLKSILHGRPDIPIYTGSMSVKGQELAGEIAEGCLLAFMDSEHPELVSDAVNRGLARRSDGRTLADFDIAPSVSVVVGDDVDACRGPIKGMLALYIGGMGSRDKNFYNDYARRSGFEAEAATIQDLFLAGRKGEAIAAVPDALVDRVALVGPKERIRDHFQRWKDLARDHHVGTLLVSGTPDLDTLAYLASC